MTSSSVASADPRATDRYGGASDVNPSRPAKSRTFWGPSSFMIQTAGTLRDFSSARRRVMGPS